MTWLIFVAHITLPALLKKKLVSKACIDLILTNRPQSVQISGVIETGLSDFHKFTITVHKSYLTGIIKNVHNLNAVTILNYVELTSARFLMTILLPLLCAFCPNQAEIYQMKILS